ncbi:MAG: preprotein translocase subunit SecE [Devosia sp.]|nr:preprotein translocase subunit SecE [Devosia sp.]
MARTNPITFLQQVRTEVSKITWPTRNETVISTIMVLAFCAIASVFFLLTDQIIAWVVTTVLSL